MKKNLQDIDKLFKDALEDHLESAPSGVWDAVNNDLDKKQAFHFREKYNRLKRLALVLLLFVFSGIAFLLYNSGQAKKNNGISQKPVLPAEQGLADEHAADKKPIPEKENAANAAAQNKDDGKKTATTIPSNNKNTDTAQHENSTTENAKDKVAASKYEINAGSTEKVAAIIHTKEDETTATHNYKKSKLSVQKNAAGSDKISIEKNTAAHLSNTRHSLLTIPTSITPANDAHAKLAAIHKLNNSFGKVLPYKYAAHTGTNGKGINANSSQDELATTKNNNKTVSPLAGYIFQPALLLPAMNEAIPGPYVPIDSTAFLSDFARDAIPMKAPVNTKGKAAGIHAFSLMVFASPNHSFTRLEDDDRLAGPGRDKMVARREENPGSSFSAGILINYGLSKHFILQSGIVFSSTKTDISPKTIYARPDNSGRTRYEFNCSSGYTYITPKSGTSPAIGDSIRVMGSNAALSYIGIPVSINYVWQKGHLLIKPGVGLSVNFLTGGKSTTNLGSWAGNQKETAIIAGLKTAYVDGSIGVGAEWMLSKRISIAVRPLLRMALTAINKDTPVKTYQNFTSLETGLKINL